MALVRRTGTWDPFRELEEMTQRMTEMFGLAPWGAAASRRERGNGGEQLLWRPAVDITESDEGYRIRVDLPGVKKEDISVTLQDGVLTVEGERKEQREEKDERVHRREVWHGRFVRSFAMPADADENAVEAKFEDGVLHIFVKRVEQQQPKPKSIQVQ